MQVVIGRRQEVFTPQSEQELFRLRYQVFKERLGWEVPVIGDQEKDYFDDCNPIYITLRNTDKQLAACARLLPSDGPTMLQDVFPQLLHGHQMPSGPKIWELSRFAVSKQTVGRHGFTTMPIRLIQAIVQLADDMGLEQYLAVTSAAFEKMLVKLGVPCIRFGPPMQVGIEKTVAFAIPVNQQLRLAAFGDQTLTILDEMEKRQPVKPFFEPTRPSREAA
ncbi:acyl-homoserine-lactone synthase [Parvibium lacunae]|uniref:Acyl-homoserine-lactone synthase n=1 Tax=Parvibium lacunae TaxID=1888893 RepID=A0A368L6L0_9BURK|nr:acyl-homoserine-lactone synthase [Parvibium lacunae]RCS59328.1 GNAT family N-acetyltransferase [Parvibium lacunae]